MVPVSMILWKLYQALVNNLYETAPVGAALHPGNRTTAQPFHQLPMYTQ